MTVIVTETGFTPDTPVEEQILSFGALSDGQDLPPGVSAIDFPNDGDPAELAPWLNRLKMIRVAFPSMGDGRGFSIARRLRAMGYTGRLRAAGPLIADQITAAREVGFDEIETSDAVAARQPERLWTRARRLSYSERLSAG